MNPTRFVLAFTGIVGVGGCSTLTMGTSQEITVITPGADHATCAVSDQSGGVLATICPPDKKIIHGMRDAILAPCST